ncbi:MAG: ATP-binding cassette domain-containing protein [Candidatus Dojkabacteria bacterium]
MAQEEVIVRFDDVTFKYNDKKITLDHADFSVRKNAKITIMGQNGAGKSTIFKLLTGEEKPTDGKINIKDGSKIGIAQQVIPSKYLELTILQYFETAFEEKKYGIEKNIKDVLNTVNLQVPNDKKVKDLSGGQKARLLLAYALIQDPDILLLDEPTNNLDQTGIEHLTGFLMFYLKTVIVISHDADFLNLFTDGVLNLDVYTHKVEQFVGNYYDVVEQIEQQRERERLVNARIEKSVKDRFEKVNKLGGKSVAMRKLANKVRSDIEDDRENIVEIRKEDKTIPEFEIPAQHLITPAIHITSVKFLRDGDITEKKVDLKLFRGDRMIIKGPNGIGKSTLIKSLLDGEGCEIGEDVRVGYYSQDFSELNMDETAFDSLKNVMFEMEIPRIYSVAGRFMLTGELLNTKIGSLSEGQKGLLCYARFMLQEPGLLIMDEPTNHINFRHIPVIAKALDDFKGALILVSHLPDFVSQIHIREELDLTRL